MKRILSLFFFATLAAVSAYAFELEGISAHFGRTLVFSDDDMELDGRDGASPAVLPYAALSVPMVFADSFYLEPQLGFYLQETKYVESTARPTLTDPEVTYGAVLMTVFELRPEFGMVFRPAGILDFGFTIAPAFVFRLPVSARDGLDAQMADIRNYYFSAGRFFDLYTGGFFGWRFADSFKLRIKAGADLPLFHLWDGEGSAFYDRLRVTATLGLVYTFN